MYLKNLASRKSRPSRNRSELSETEFRLECQFAETCEPLVLSSLIRSLHSLAFSALVHLGEQVMVNFEDIVTGYLSSAGTEDLLRIKKSERGSGSHSGKRAAGVNVHLRPAVPSTRPSRCLKMMKGISLRGPVHPDLRICCTTLESADWKRSRGNFGEAEKAKLLRK
ncbi:hypothetical protein MHYP_G00001930 [Metynnis hypsauchen]